MRSADVALFLWVRTAAQAIESAVDAVLERGLRTYDLYREQPNETKVSTTEMGDAIAQQVADSV